MILVKKNIFKNNIILDKKKIALIPTPIDKTLVKIKNNNKAPKLGQNNSLLKK